MTVRARSAQRRTGRTNAPVYLGTSLDLDLRNWIRRRADELEAGTLSRSAIHDVVRLLRNVADQRSIAELFPQQLKRRPPSAHRFWMVVDVLVDEMLNGKKASKSRAAERWDNETDTVQKAVKAMRAQAMQYINGRLGVRAMNVDGEARSQDLRALAREIEVVRSAIPKPRKSHRY
jgi:hypothetical protein